MTMGIGFDMATHWAIAIGIHHYSQLDAIPNAALDAASIRDFFAEAGSPRQVYYFAEDASPVTLEGATLETRPTLANLQQFFQVRFAQPFLSPEDTLWFFFSGHGLNSGPQDYLLPQDADPSNAETTAIALDDIATYLRRSGTANIVMLLDACHTETQQFGQGFGTEPHGVISLFGSNFGQTSSYIYSLGHHAFTHALLEGLQRMAGFRHATLDHLELYLRDRLPKLTQRYQLPVQHPRLHVDPSLSSAAIAMPCIATARSPFQRLLAVLPGWATDERNGRTIGVATALATVAIGTGTGYLFYLNQNSTPASRLAWAGANSSRQTTASTSSSPVSANPSTSQTPTTVDAAVAATATLKPGRYYAEAAKLSTSRREVATQGARMCIKKIDGGATAAVSPQVMVSSVSRRPDGFYIDATQEKLRLGNLLAEFSDRVATWQRVETDPDMTGAMGDCLASSRRFVYRGN
jgi:hypothetical protein